MGMIRRWQRVAVMAAAVGLLAGMGFPASAQPAGTPSSADEAKLVLLEAKGKAKKIVESAGRHKQARVRLAGLEASQHAPSLADDMARLGLGDENRAVRFAALVTVGKLKITKLAAAASDLQKDTDPSVKAAAIYALKRCGRKVDLTPLAQMLGSNKPSTRANAAMLIGMLDDRAAIPMLKDMAAKTMPRVSNAERTWVRLQFAEAIIRLNPNNDEVLGTIRAAMYSNVDEVRVLAMQILGDVKDRSVRVGLAHIVKRPNPLQIRIAAARALAQMGDNQGSELLLDTSRYDEQKLKEDLEKFADKHKGNDPQLQEIKALLKSKELRVRAAAEIRAQAAIALGWVKNKAVSKRLVEMLDDGDTIVEVAAASSVLRASR